MSKALRFNVSAPFADAYVPVIRAKARQLGVRGWLVQLTATQLTGVFVGPAHDVQSMKSRFTACMEAGNNANNTLEFEDEEDIATVSYLPRRFLMLRATDLHV